ncbi:MAG: nuclear transport factor 2 family protein [Alphaproteobacteria bacterium]|nr:nuclear transport factor 2 family protein [Alphaproteobacteria bacterium]
MTAPRNLLAITQRWADAFSAPMPGGMPALLALATEDIHFTDPFNDVRGKPGLEAILEDMLERCQAPSFTVHDVTASDRAGYIRWSFSFIPKGQKETWNFEGMSEILIAQDGRVQAHHDHWDSGGQLYAKLPVIGWIIRRIRSMIQA